MYKCCVQLLALFGYCTLSLSTIYFISVQSTCYKKNFVTAYWFWYWSYIKCNLFFDFNVFLFRLHSLRIFWLARTMRVSFLYKGYRTNFFHLGPCFGIFLWSFYIEVFLFYSLKTFIKKKSFLFDIIRFGVEPHWHKRQDSDSACRTLPEGLHN